MQKYFIILVSILVLAIIVLYYLIDERRKTVEQLGRFVAAGNSIAPNMIDEFTRMDSVSAEPMTLVFNMSIVDDSQVYEPASQEVKMLKWFRTSVCTVPEIQSKLLQKGISIKYRYWDSDGKHLGEHRFTRDKC